MGKKKPATKAPAKPKKKAAAKLPKGKNHFTKHVGKRRAAVTKAVPKVEGILSDSPAPDKKKKKRGKLKHEDLPLHIRMNYEAAGKKLGDK